MEELKRLGLENPEQDPSTPVIIQCFSGDILEKLKKMGCRHPKTFLVNEAGGKMDGTRQAEKNQIIRRRNRS